MHRYGAQSEQYHPQLDCPYDKVELARTWPFEPQWSSRRRADKSSYHQVHQVAVKPDITGLVEYKTDQLGHQTVRA